MHRLSWLLHIGFFEISHVECTCNLFGRGNNWVCYVSRFFGLWVAPGLVARCLLTLLQAGVFFLMLEVVGTTLDHTFQWLSSLICINHFSKLPICPTEGESSVHRYSEHCVIRVQCWRRSFTMTLNLAVSLGFKRQLSGTSAK